MPRPRCSAQALPFLRIMFVGSIGMMLFFMLGGALRSAGDARTPLRLGIVMTVLNIVFNVVFIRGLGPIPAFGTAGSAMGTVIAIGGVAAFALLQLSRGGWVVRVPGAAAHCARLERHPRAVPLRAAHGHPGHRDEHRRRAAARRSSDRFAQSAAAQAAYAVAYTELFSLDHVDLGRPDGRRGRRRGAEPGRGAARTAPTQRVHVAARIGLGGAAVVGLLFLVRSARRCSASSA